MPGGPCQAVPGTLAGRENIVTPWAIACSNLGCGRIRRTNVTVTVIGDKTCLETGVIPPPARGRFFQELSIACNLLASSTILAND